MSDRLDKSDKSDSRYKKTGYSKYPDLKVNGHLFPTWILKNFRKYKLPDIIKKEGVDPCSSVKESKLELRTYQKFISQYMNFESVYRDILIYHGLGSGKTATAINVYNSLYNYTSGWNVFLLIKASIKPSWQRDIERWLQKDQYEYRYKNIIFINYDSPFADKKFLEEVKKVDSSKKSMYIIDEAHRFISNVYSNVSSNSGKRALVIYDHIIQNKKDDPDTRVILLSATPAINYPFELGLMFNLLRPGIFPSKESQFNQLFVTESNYKSLNKQNKNMFQRRIIGLVSYYIGQTPDLYASKTMHYVNVPMSTYQEQVYTTFEDIEEKATKNARAKGRTKSSSSTFNSYTRQACNFVFPYINQKINGETRPRPSTYRISEREASKLLEAIEESDTSTASKTKVDVTGKIMQVTEWMNALKNFANSFEKYLFDLDSDDRDKKHTVLDDFKTYREVYNSDYDKFNSSIDQSKLSSLYKAMYLSSSKMTRILFSVMGSPGPCMVYSNYVKMEGIQMFKLYLKMVDFYSFMDTKKLLPDRIGYVEFHGDIKNIEDRNKGVVEFNKPENKTGDLLRIIIISAAGSEGLSLRNVRQVHIMEPAWTEVTVSQAIGRAVRQCSHSDLRIEDRTVDVFRYRSVRQKIVKITTDQYIESVARTKDSLIQSFLDAMKEVAVDCVLNKNHNKLVQDYKCFQFDEKSLFSKTVGPAYKESLVDDLKMNNGSNSLTSTTVKIKVMEIKAVMKMSNLSSTSDEPDVYSQPETYWYYDESKTVYDHDLHFAVGRVAVDENKLPIKLDKDTYVIDYVIPIPLLQKI